MPEDKVISMNNNELEEKIKELEERGEKIEEKTKQAMELLEEIKNEFERLQDMVLSNSKEPEFGISDTKKVNDSKEGLKTSYQITMNGSSEEEKVLEKGWWQAEKNFRWGGKGKKHPTLNFDVVPNKDYGLEAKIFIPKVLARKLIRVLVNNKELDSFTVENEEKLKKVILIPKGIITNNKLKIVFKSSFWVPNKLDPSLEDGRTLSMAFDYINLKPI